MFYSIDNLTNELIISSHIDKKDSLNIYKKYTCLSCNDNKCIFISPNNGYQKHFRHSIDNNNNCSLKNKKNEFNNEYIYNWLNYFNNSIIKKYWFNIKLEEINKNEEILLIRYEIQKEYIIKEFEKFSTENNKVIWILSLECRNFKEIIYKNHQYYIDFKGRNDIPVYNVNKSIVYLDTSYNTIIKIHLNKCHDHYGYLIDIIDFNIFYETYKHLFIKKPLRDEWYYNKRINTIKKNEELILIRLEKLEQERLKKLELKEKLQQERLEKMEKWRLENLKKLEQERLNKEITEEQQLKNHYNDYYNDITELNKYDYIYNLYYNNNNQICYNCFTFKIKVKCDICNINLCLSCCQNIYKNIRKCSFCNNTFRIYKTIVNNVYIL